MQPTGGEPTLDVCFMLDTSLDSSSTMQCKYLRNVSVLLPHHMASDLKVTVISTSNSKIRGGMKIKPVLRGEKEIN
jgi:hypothetical protein